MFYVFMLILVAGVWPVISDMLKRIKYDKPTHVHIVYLSIVTVAVMGLILLNTITSIS